MSKTCPIDGKPVEDWCKTRPRKYCSVRCAKAARFKGNNIVEVSGRTRALRLYPETKPCAKCPNPKGERHHKDGNTRNNAPDNIEFLCRRCHMASDGRLEKLRKSAPGRSTVALKTRKAKLGY